MQPSEASKVVTLDPDWLWSEQAIRQGCMGVLCVAEQELETRTSLFLFHVRL